MVEPLLERVRTRMVFVVGKGGVGKTTTASRLACALAEQSTTHLISTDPAHSLKDFFADKPKPANLIIEEFDARSYADAFFDELREPVIELIERGTYLDRADAAGFFDLSIPGIDEVMAALRLVELHDSDVEKIVVDTAPTGHTLRLLEAPGVIESWVSAGRALADKAGAVSAGLVGQAVPLQAEALLDAWREKARRFRDDVLREASAVVVTREGNVVAAETERLRTELAAHGLQIASTVVVQTDSHPSVVRPDCPAAAWIRQQQAHLFWAAGKGGVGKSTCAAAIATTLAEDRNVCVVSTDPAGSLTEIFGVTVGVEAVQVENNLYARQVDAAAEFARMRREFTDSVDDVFESLGLHHAAQLDRKVVQSLWDFAPPGLDEIISLIEIVEDAAAYEALVIDSAPTGHFLRLIQMPELALEWVRALLRLIVKYGAVASLDALAHDLLGFAKRLNQMKQDLSTPGKTAVFVVTLDEPLVTAETARLLAALHAAEVPVAATILNRAEGGARSVKIQASSRQISAPALDKEIVGTAALRSFLAQWELHGE